MQPNTEPHRVAPDDAVIHVQGLVSHYGARRILDGVDLTVRQGEIVVIMGGSGSGKSTLLRHLVGLHRASAGSVRVLGKDIGTLRARELFAMRRGMGVAFQGGALFSSMSVGENVELPLRQNTKLDRNTIRIMARMKLEMMNLGEQEDLMPSELSGGMVKRAGLARAVVMDPKLLFFDEPTAGLDPVNAAELDDLILKLRDAMRMSIVVITHDLDSAFKIADRICVVDGGRMILTGTVDEIRASADPRISNMVERRPREQEIHVDEYLKRLTE